MAQIIGITSEGLQATIRRLLPSQQGFGEDLQASNVIQPIIDLTPAAEGSTIPQNLQQCWDFSTITTTVIGASTTSLTSTPGFYKVGLVSSMHYASASNESVQVIIGDATTDKAIWVWAENLATPNEIFSIESTELVIFLRAGDTLKLSTTGSTHTSIWYRQIADVYGNLNNPLGFVSQ